MSSIRQATVRMPKIFNLLSYLKKGRQQILIGQFCLKMTEMFVLFPKYSCISFLLGNKLIKQPTVERSNTTSASRAVVRVQIDLTHHSGIQ